MQVESSSGGNPPSSCLVGPDNSVKAERGTNISTTTGAAVGTAASISTDANVSSNKGAVTSLNSGAVLNAPCETILKPSAVVVDSMNSGLTTGGMSSDCQRSRPSGSIESSEVMTTLPSRVGRSASVIGKGTSFLPSSPSATTSTLPRKFSSVVINPEVFPLDLNASRESCV